MNHFCTYSDQGYVARLLCLHASLVAQRTPFVLHVLCFDEKSAAVVDAQHQPSLQAIRLSEVLQADPAYAALREQRSKVEFYFTSTPVLVRYCFSRAPAAAQMTYLDADLYFFGPPSEVFAAQAEASVAIVPHRFPPRLRHLEKNGIYNVGWVSFRRDADALACLEWWRERCLEWCHDFASDGRYADQGYLDQFPEKFRGVRALDDPGINAAPWNIDQARIGSSNRRLLIDGRPLLFFHFQGLRELMPGWFDPGFLSYSSTMTQALRDLVYLPYLRKLVPLQRELEATHGIAPQRGYHRLNPGRSWRARCDRFVIRRLLPLYRRLRVQLVHCAPE